MPVNKASIPLIRSDESTSRRLYSNSEMDVLVIVSSTLIAVMMPTPIKREKYRVLF